MAKQTGFWNHWLTGGKIFLAGLIASVAVGIIYAIMMGLASLLNGGYLIAGVLSMAVYLLLGFFLLGYFNNKFWGFK